MKEEPGRGGQGERRALFLRRWRRLQRKRRRAGKEDGASWGLGLALAVAARLVLWENGGCSWKLWGREPGCAAAAAALGGGEEQGAARLGGGREGGEGLGKRAGED